MKQLTLFTYEHSVVLDQKKNFFFLYLFALFKILLLSDTLSSTIFLKLKLIQLIYLKRKKEETKHTKKYFSFYEKYKLVRNYRAANFLRGKMKILFDKFLFCRKCLF